MPEPRTIDVPGVSWIEDLLDWLQRNARAVLIAGVALQLAVLVAMIVMPTNTLLTGEKVLLRVVPVDPRDLFRGDYVILGYEFSTIPPDVLPGLGNDNNNPQTVFVLLEPEEDGRHWRAAGYSLERPSGVYLEGETTTWRRLNFGIESFYVQEGRGLEYEQAVRDQKLAAEAVVDADGKAVLTQLIVE